MLLEARLPFWCVSASNLHQIQQTWMSKNNHLDTSTSNAVISNYSSLRWSSRATPGNGVNMAPPLWIPATCEIDGQTLHYLLYRTAETYLWSASISSNDNTVPVGCSLPQPLPVSTLSASQTFASLRVTSARLEPVHVYVEAKERSAHTAGTQDLGGLGFAVLQRTEFR